MGVVPLEGVDEGGYHNNIENKYTILGNNQSEKDTMPNSRLFNILHVSFEDIRLYYAIKWGLLKSKDVIDFEWIH